MVNLANNCDILARLLVLVLVLDLVVGRIVLEVVLILSGLGDKVFVKDLACFIELVEPCFDAKDVDDVENESEEDDVDDLLVEPLQSFLRVWLPDGDGTQCLPPPLLFVIFDRVRVVRGARADDCCILSYVRRIVTIKAEITIGNGPW